jgi:hypothetical protein
MSDTLPHTPGSLAILRARGRRAQVPGQQKVMQGNPAPPPPVTLGRPAPQTPKPAGPTRPPLKIRR